MHICTGCGSQGFEPSTIGPDRCTFCDGTEGGCGPEVVQSIAELEYLTDGYRHLICRPYSIENLHRMAQELGINRCWFHRDHYDIPLTRVAEIESKCRKVSMREIARIARKIN